MKLQGQRLKHNKFRVLFGGKMTYYEEDFYYEPSEFDEQVDEFKKLLMSSVKKEFLEEMDRLKKENSELQGIKENWEEIQNSYARKEYELEDHKKKSLSEAKRMALKDLIKDYQIILYTASSKTIQKQKCDNCNEKRELSFSTPKGRKFTCSCDCATGDSVYFPQANIAYEFAVRDNYSRNLLVWYKRFEKDDYFNVFNIYDSGGTVPENIYKEGMEYEGLTSYRIYFKTEEECQKYCDWLNSRKNKE